MRAFWFSAVAILIPASAMAASSCSATNQDTPPQTCSVTCPTPEAALCNDGPRTVRPFCACVGNVTAPTLPTTTTTTATGLRSVTSGTSR